MNRYRVAESRDRSSETSPFGGIVHTAPSPSSAAAEQPCVARQPILDRDGRVFAYELLYRRSATAHMCDVDVEAASARVIVDAFLSIGLDTLVSGKRAFLNISRDGLVSGAPTLLPAATTIIELLEEVTGDAEVLERCRQLKESGYAIALDDFVPTGRNAALVPFADYIKVDFRALPDAGARAEVLASVQNTGAQLLAEKVETREEHRAAVAEGFKYFQGYYFGRPVSREARHIPASQLAHTTLVVRLGDPDISVAALEDVIKHDAALTHRVLRAVNSAATPLRTELRSIHQAIMLLGRDTIRRWAALWAMAALGSGTRREIVITSVIRARCCELLDTTAPIDPGNGFLLGMCSMFDALLDQPMEAIVSHLPIDYDVRHALTGDSNRRRALLDTVIAYERGDWARYEACAREAQVEAAALPFAYQEALRWAHAFSAAPA